jgi:PAS domain S-box-containing protein
MTSASPQSEDRFLVLMPTLQDAARTCELLADENLVGVPCADMEALCKEIPKGVGVVLLTDEATRGNKAACLLKALGEQPAWSDIPLLVLTREGDVSNTAFLESVNATLAERPVRKRTLLSLIRSGLRARRRQYELRAHLVERQEAAEALLAERERLRVTLASIGDAVISTDADGRVTFLNGVAETLTGWNLHDATGRRLPEIFRIVNEHSRNSVENPAFRALREGVIVGLANHTLLISRDGTERPIDDSAAPIRDGLGDIIGAVLVFRDVTERKRAEEARASLAAIVESSDDAIISKTLDGTIRSWNEGAERVFGYKAIDVIGQPITLIIPPDRLGEEREILGRLSRGERIDHFETVRKTKDGRLVDISLTVSPVRDTGGRVVGASKIARDITERKRAEQALREADRRKDEFIALLAHELRNPLAPIRNGLEVMRLDPADAEAVGQARSMMERQLAHMVRLIDDLLDVSRINLNKMELRRTRVDLSDIITSAVEIARPLIDEGGHSLSVSLPPAAFMLHADPTRLAQIFGNLLSNSARYTLAGGHIWLTVERRGNDAVISVRDDGIGIPPESVDSIFEIFSQIDRSVERSSGGLGIGLALVKGLVEMHGGTVSAHSQGLGQGATFTVRLPLLEGSSERDAVVQSPASLLREKSRVRFLVVDDNRDSATSMAMMLKLIGHEVRTANDGLEAVTAAEQFRPQVILMDVGMPKLNGYEATRRIREQAWGKSIRIVALTGWGKEDDRANSKDAGCDGHLVKPVSLPELERVLAELGGKQGPQD